MAQWTYPKAGCTSNVDFTLMATPAAIPVTWRGIWSDVRDAVCEYEGVDQKIII